MEEGLPEEQSPEAREGQLLHDYSWHDVLDRSFLSPKQRDLLEINDQLFEQVRQRIIKLCPGKSWHTNELTLGTELGVSISGTPDVLTVFPEDDATWVNDSKFGFAPVERADLNLQLRTYALLAYDHHGKKHTFVSITQPRLPYDERITVAIYTTDEIQKSREEIAYIVKRSEDPKAKLIAGEEQCRYCKAKLNCPAFREKFKQLYPFNPKMDLSVALRTDMIEKRLAALKDGDLEKVLSAISLAGMVKKAAHEEARRRIEKGGLKNFTAAKDFEVREIADPQRAISLLTLGGIQTKEQILAICEIPIGKLEEAYRKETDCTWKEAKDKINHILRSVLETTERKGRITHK